jgi:putative hydrolase of the HAD superfamily
MRLPALIFDFGNVVAFFDYQKVSDRLGQRLGVAGAVIWEQLQARGFARAHARLEAGEMTPVAFAEAITAQLGLSLPFEEFVRDWEDIFWLNEPISRLIGLLKSRGYTLILGSNTNSMHAAHFRRKFAATLDQFDALVVSHDVGCLKPHARFYDACARAAGVPAASCVFIDDLAENVEGARRVGMLGLQYTDLPRLIDGLRALGVEIAPGEC